MGSRIYKKINRLKIRHDKNVVYALSLEIFLRLYRYSLVRKVSQLFFLPKKPKGLIFLFGCYNSGSTILKQLIALHPNVSSPDQESYHYTNSYHDIENGLLLRGAPGLIRYYMYLGAMVFDKKKYLSDMQPWITPRKYFLDKSVPLTLYGPALVKMFSGAKTIVIRRDKLGITRGIKKRGKAIGLAERIFPNGVFTDSFCDAIYNQFDERLNQMEGDTNIDSYSVSYNMLLEDPVRVLKGVFEFLGLEDCDIRYVDNVLHCGDKSMVLRSNYWK